MPSVVSRAAVADGTDLLVLHWSPGLATTGRASSEPPWASLLLVHGINEHSGRYEHVGDQLAAAGIDVWSYDQRGNGGSGGRRAYVDRWSQIHDDLGERFSALKGTAAGRPTVLYGHSLGGLIVAGYLLSDRPKPDVAILGSPALDSDVPGWQKAFARTLSRVAPTMALKSDFDGSKLSRDPNVGQVYEADPARNRSTTTRFGAEALAEQVRVRGLASRGFGIPTLVIHGEDDRLVPISASAGLQGAPGVERRTYPGLRHELHNEPEGAAIIDEVIAWLRDQLDK